MIAIRSPLPASRFQFPVLSPAFAGVARSPDRRGSSRFRVVAGPKLRTDGPPASGEGVGAVCWVLEAVHGCNFVA